VVSGHTRPAGVWKFTYAVAISRKVVGARRRHEKCQKEVVSLE
jgi:hypothetical protein